MEVYRGSGIPEGTPSEKQNRVWKGDNATAIVPGSNLFQVTATNLPGRDFPQARLKVSADTVF